MTIAALTSNAPLAPMPDCDNARLALFAMRRIGAHGLNDAVAAQALVHGFGRDFRRPLTLIRALMADLASASTMPIAIAPVCCGRMTPSERTLVTILARCETQPDSAAVLLGDLLGVRRADGVLASATAVAAAFADAGRPIGRG
ncbi:DUF6628 family protein [Sphingomonas immobilis]|uniref:Uncharacterized protein n=1 Tax=Sphingomonas immobilis TaxID=3063997 RepID=A0ABT8ZYI4_9SPHN|nr:DUF6628 family protein [Sphingomonas sp. CA1-15]MDO7842641.1 hypothetical protein [Sphingomonas sp. CA1-15]